MSKKKRKYRILKFFSNEHGEYYHYPQVEKGFWFFKYWSSCNGRAYYREEDAKEIIEKHAAGKEKTVLREDQVTYTGFH